MLLRLVRYWAGLRACIGSMLARPGVVSACLPGRGAVCAAALGLRTQFCEDRAKPHRIKAAPIACDGALRPMFATPDFCFKSAKSAEPLASCRTCSSHRLKSLIGLRFGVVWRHTGTVGVATCAREGPSLVRPRAYEMIQLCCAASMACCNAPFRRTWLKPDGRGLARIDVSNATPRCVARRANVERTGPGSILGSCKTPLSEMTHC